MERSRLSNTPGWKQNKQHHGWRQHILRKLGITLTARKNAGKKVLHITDTTIESNLMKWIIKKCPKLCTGLGKSKNHMAKPIMKEIFIPVQQKGRRIRLKL